jgi:pyridoxal phosphate enzyme (YggS family)
MEQQDLNEILDEVRSKIAAACERSGRNVDDVQIVAVTKTHGAEVVNEAWAAGLGIIGENKVQEAAWKKEASASGPEWHLIGHLQSNKVRQALEIFDFIHSVDSVRLAEEIDKKCSKLGVRQGILIEVNIGMEEAKSGIAPDEFGKFMEEISAFPSLDVRGMMTMAPKCTENEEFRKYFYESCRIFLDFFAKTTHNIGEPVLSMGMSDSYECAIEEGSTMVRVGSAIFGSRKYN